MPKPLRLVLARDPAWARWVGQLVVRAIGAWLRRIARARGLVAPRTGAVVFSQRFGGLVNLNVDYHVIVPDGVFINDSERLAFVIKGPHADCVESGMGRHDIYDDRVVVIGRRPHNRSRPSTGNGDRSAPVCGSLDVEER